MGAAALRETDDAAAEQDAGAQALIEVESLRVRCETLESMVVERGLENRRLEEENREGEAGLEKALVMLHKMRRESIEVRTLKMRSLERLSENLRSLVLASTVARVDASGLSATQFLRDYVGPSQPLVITGLGSAEWPCLSKWTEEYLLNTAGDTEVSVNVTPDGLGDVVNDEGLFVRPLEERMKFSHFWQRLSDKEGHGEVLYMSKQNDCLREELPQLYRDVPEVVPLAKEAFGNEPDAVNIWIGNGRAVSSCHKDHYENLFVVVKGVKVFTLLPPAAAPFLHERRCRPAEYARSEVPIGSASASGAGGYGAAKPGGTDRAWTVVPDPPEAASVPWVPVDVAKPDLQRFPDASKAPSVEVRVGPGEMLYLPAMWYHRVAQEGLTIGVNYWHDMRFGEAYCYHQYLRDSVGLEVGGDEAAAAARVLHTALSGQP